MALHEATVTDSGDVALGDVAFRPDAPVALEAGERVAVGIRPSGAHVAERLRGPHLRGRVTRRDYLGGDCFLEVDISTEHAIVVRAEPEDAVHVGDVVNVEIRPGAAHLFGASGERAGGLSLLGPP
ncbi:MAG: TOBE domain-containing protein [bacterium]|nr:TOBE domain-containing protein [bacterium]